MKYKHMSLAEAKKRGITLTLKEGYYLELKHSLMPCFPAVFTEGEDVVLALDIEVLKEVYELLPKRLCKVVKSNFVVNEEIGIGFMLDNYLRDEAHSLRLVNMEEVRKLKEKEKPFMWAPGLISFVEVSSDFTPFDCFENI